MSFKARITALTGEYIGIASGFTAGFGGTVGTGVLVATQVVLTAPADPMSLKPSLHL